MRVMDPLPTIFRKGMCHPAGRWAARGTSMCGVGVGMTIHFGTRGKKHTVRAVRAVPGSCRDLGLAISPDPCLSVPPLEKRVANLWQLARGSSTTNTALRAIHVSVNQSGSNSSVGKKNNLDMDRTVIGNGKKRRGCSNGGMG